MARPHASRSRCRLPNAAPRRSGAVWAPVDYALTPLGGTLTEPLNALYRWTEEHLKEIQRARRESEKGRPGLGANRTT